MLTFFSLPNQHHDAGTDPRAIQHNHWKFWPASCGSGGPGRREWWLDFVGVSATR